MKYTLSLALVTSLALTGSMAHAQNTKPFPDVPKDHWAYQAVMELKEKGILIGYPDGSFNGEGAKDKSTHISTPDVITQKAASQQDKAGNAQKKNQEPDSRVSIHREGGLTPEVNTAYMDLQETGVLKRPEGRWGSDITRYEYAVSIKRALESLVPKKGRGDEGDISVTPNAVVSKTTPKQIQELLLLVSEFKGELASLGVDVEKVTHRLENLIPEKETPHPMSSTQPQLQNP